MSRFKKLAFGSICAVALLALSAQESQACLFCGWFGQSCFRPVSCCRPVRCYRPVRCCRPACPTPCAAPACSTGACGRGGYGVPTYGGQTFSAPSPCGPGGCGVMRPRRNRATAVRVRRVPQTIARPAAVPTAPRYTAPVRVRTRTPQREPVARRVDSRIVRTTSARNEVRKVNLGWVAVSK